MIAILFWLFSFLPTSTTQQPPTPSYLNWKHHSKVTPARQQGSCNSCWALVSTSLAESYLAIHTGELLELSVEYVFECTSGGGCNGGFVNRALRVITEGGLPRES
jgi:hypothetical protein